MLVLATVALSACGAEARTTSLVFDGRFPSASVGRGAWDRTFITKPGSDDAPVYQTAVRRRSSGAAALLDVGGDALAERIEFHKDLSAGVAEGTEYWIAFSVLIPRGPPDPFASGRETYFQIVSKFNPVLCDVSRGGASTELEIVRIGGVDRWQWIQTGGKGKCWVTPVLLTGVPVVTDRWYDFVVHMRIGTVAADKPLTEIFWRNGRPNTTWRLALRSSAPNLARSLAFPGSIRIQHGLYKSQGPERSRVYEGGLVVAGSRSAAETAAFG